MTVANSQFIDESRSNGGNGFSMKIRGLEIETVRSSNPYDGRLIVGNFEANSTGQYFSNGNFTNVTVANTITITNMIVANGAIGAAGKIIRSDGTKIFWGPDGGSGGGGGGQTNVFSSITVTGQPTIYADGGFDSLQFANGYGLIFTTDNATDKITMRVSGMFASNTYVTSVFQTKAIERAALANTNIYINNVKTSVAGTNTALRTMIADRQQVANARAWLANTNSFIKSQLANTNLAITNVKGNLTSTNTALRLLISDRLQVANAKIWLANTNSFIKSQLANTNLAITNVKTGLTSTNTAIRAIITVDKANLQSTNTALRLLISDRMQVANVKSYMANTNSWIKQQLANTNLAITNVKGNLTSTNTALRLLISDRLQVANAKVWLANTNSFIKSQLANTNLAITNVKTGLTSTNTALRLLIADRLQVANAATLYATKINPTTSGIWAHTGRATISTNIIVSGNSVQGGAGKLSITNGRTRANGYMVVTDRFDVSGNTNLGSPGKKTIVNGMLVSNGTFSVSTNLSVTGNTTTNKLSATSRAVVTGNTVLGSAGKLTIINGRQIGNGYSSVSARFDVTGNTNLGGSGKRTIITGLLSANGRVDVGTNLNVTANTTINALIANGSIGTSGYVLKSDGTKVYWGAPPSSNSSSSVAQNPIINGDFNIWQRGTSFVSAAAATYTADRWYYGKSGAMVHDVSRSTDVPTVAQAGRLFNYSLLVDCTTVDGSIAAGDYCNVQQIIEGYNFLPIAQRTFTLSFWVKATKTGTYCVALSNSTPDRSYVAEYTINVTDTWEYKTVTISASPAAGTWNYTNGAGLRVIFTLACGSTYQTTANAWQTGNYIATSSQVNATDSTSNNFRLCGVRIDPGYQALTPTEPRSFGDELLLCQRYWHNYYIPMSNGFLSYYGGSAALSMVYVHPATMRTTPTLSITNSGIEYYSYAGVWTATTLTSWYLNAHSAQFYCGADGDGRGKLVRSGSSGVDPAPLINLNAEL